MSDEFDELNLSENRSFREIQKLSISFGAKLIIPIVFVSRLLFLLIVVSLFADTS